MRKTLRTMVCWTLALALVWASVSSVVAAEHTVSSTALKLGANHVTASVDTTTIFKFKPTAVGNYRVSVDDPAAILNFWYGSSQYVSMPAYDAVDGSVVVTCTSVGQSLLIGLSGVTSATITIASEPGYVAPTKVTYTTYYNQHTPSRSFTMTKNPLTAVDITQAQTVVADAKGICHLGEVNGPILYVDLRASRFTDLYKLFYPDDVEGEEWPPIDVMRGRYSETHGYDFVTAMVDYADALDGNFYYLTVDLMKYLQCYGTDQGWYIPRYSPFAPIQKGAFIQEAAWLVNTYYVDPAVVPEQPETPADNATIDFTDKANRVYYSAEQQVWEQNGITVTNDKGAATSNVGDYGGDGYPARFYKSSTVTIEYPGMTKIVIDCTGLDVKYVDGWTDSFSAAATATKDGDVVTIELAQPADAFVWEQLTAQSRAYYITVYSGSDAPVVPPVTPDEPDEPDVPDEPVEGEIETDYPFLFGMVQENLSMEDVYFLDGGMSTYYMTTTTDENEAIFVYLEKTAGGYYLYALDEEDNKVYINMVVSGTHVNGVYESAPSTVYNYDYDLWTLVSEVNGELYAFGTRNDREYTTVGPVKVSYNGFHMDLYYFTDDEECDHDYEIIDETAPTCGEDGMTVYACTICGEEFVEPIPATGEHTYDDAYDANCNGCGAFRDVPEKPMEPVGSFVVSTVEGVVGDTVQMTVSAINNPGIVSTKVKVYFDNAALKFVGFTEGHFALGGYSTSDPDMANTNGYFIINWCDATHPNSTADLLGTLSFEILEGTAAGFYGVTVEVSCEDDVFNANDETVWFDAVNGGVTVTDVIPGDVDGNGTLNNRDLGLLQQYLNEYDMSGKPFELSACDLDGNGKVNNRDLGALQKLLNR